jgi:NADH-quinone oxidoreductase subunit G
MESGPQVPPPALTPFFWAPGWNSIQSVNKFQGEIGGPLRGGDPGTRLIDPAQQSTWSYFPEIPATFRTESDSWLLVPCFHIFGSEELSRLATGISQLVPRAFVGLNATDAARLGVKTGDLTRVAIDGSIYDLEASLRPDVPLGVALLPAGIAPVDGASLPAPGKLAAATVHANEVAK